ncbi:MAG: molecular chaperone [Roseburia sp.]
MPEVKIMEDNRTEQLEAIETMMEYNDRILKNIPILVKELSGERLDDTDKFLDSIIKAINWEMEVINLTMDVLNDGKERILKEKVNEKIIALSDAINSKEDAKMAEAFEGMLPILETVGAAAKEVMA